MIAMPRHAERACYSVLVLIALSSAGCGRPSRVPVSGTVTLDGVPLDNGAITFVAESGAAVGGGPLANGAFKATLPFGNHRVQIVASRAVPGKIVPGMDTPVMESIVPARYNSATTLTAEVKEAGQTFDFKLQSKK